MPPYTGPRRAPLTGPERDRNARGALGAQLAEGAVPTRAVTRRQAERYIPPAAAGLAVIAQGQFHATDLSAFTTTATYTVPFDHDDASDPGWWQYNSSTVAVDVLQSGWYVAHTYVGIASATAGDVFRVTLQPGSVGLGICYSIADSSGVADCAAALAIFYQSSVPVSAFQVTVEQIGGTGTGAFLNAAYLNLLALSGETL